MATLTKAAKGAKRLSVSTVVTSTLEMSEGIGFWLSLEDETHRYQLSFRASELRLLADAIAAHLASMEA